AQARIADLAVDAFDLVFLCAEAEVFDALMSEHEDVTGLLQGRFEEIQVGYFQIDVRKPWIRDVARSCGGAESHPHRVEGNIDGAVLTPESPTTWTSPPPALHLVGGRVGWLGFGQLTLLARLFAFVTCEHSYDGEGLPVYVDDFANRHDFLAN